jgi:phosphatidylglycerol:prolipoprotein diacylglycerol transferase
VRSTLFYLPHEWMGIPWTGCGWLLAIWTLLGLIAGWIAFRRHGMAKAISEGLFGWLLVAGVILWLLPRMETHLEDGSPEGRWLGIPVRGYGLMLTTGVLSALAICGQRSRRLGLSPDSLYSLALWTCAGGIAGARIFYVVQKWSLLPGESWGEKLWTAIQFTEGGLVVYGAVMGGIVAIWAWCRKNRQQVLAILDLVAPGFLLGLAFGRIGCLLHGCCFGGVCHSHWLPHIAFPAGSEPYLSQLIDGALLGLQLEPQTASGPRRILGVEPGSWAAAEGFRVGQRVEALEPIVSWPPADRDPAGPRPTGARLRVDGRPYLIPPESLPQRSLPLHPAQLYASLNALILAVLLYLAWPWPRRDGVILAAGLILYGVLRILEEVIRDDEQGQFGTSLTISQWVSLAGIAAGIGLMVWLRNRPMGRVRDRYALPTASGRLDPSQSAGG